MEYPLLPSAVQNSMTPASEIRAPSVNAVAGAILEAVQGIAGGSGGVTDHGLLTGLDDDDHIQYLTPGRGDLRFAQLSHAHNTEFITDFVEATQDVVGAMVQAAGGTYNDVSNSIELPGLLTVQDEGATQSEVANIFNFVGAGVTAQGGGSLVTVTIPGAGSATITIKEGDSLVSADISVIDFGAGFDVTQLPDGEANIALDLSEYAAAALPLAGGGTGSTTASGARTALGISTVGATGSAADLTGNLAVARLNGGTNAAADTFWCGDGSWKATGGAGGSTNLTYSRDGTSVTVLSDTGTDAVLPAATTSLAGLLTAADKLLLDQAAPLIPAVITDATTARTLSAGDNGAIIRFTNSSPITVTVPTAFSGCSCVLQWLDTVGTVTVTPQTTAVNGGSDPIVLSAGRGAVALMPTGVANSWDLQGSIGEFTAADISDSTAVGRSVLMAVDAAAARSAIGAIATVASTDISDSTSVGRAVVVATNAAAGRSAIGAATTSQVAGIGALIEIAADKTYTLMIDAPFAWTATKITAKTSSGTCTVQATIQGTNMTGGSLAVTSTAGSSTITAANAVSTGNTVAVVVTSNSTALDLAMTISGTRTLS
jgi:hypothetical protein